MSWLDAISSGLTAGTQGAAGYLEGQQKGRKEQEDRAMRAAALLRQKHIDEQNALLQSAQIKNYEAEAQARLAPKPAEPFTLSEGQQRFDADGNPIASGAKKRVAPVTRNTATGIQQFNEDTGAWDVVKDASGKPVMPFAPPAGVTYLQGMGASGPEFFTAPTRQGAGAPASTGISPVPPQGRAAGQGGLKVQADLRDANARLRNLDNALDQLNANPDAFGLKNKLPNMVRQRLPWRNNPIDAASIGSLEYVVGDLRKDRFGGALTPLEAEKAEKIFSEASSPPKVIAAQLSVIRKAVAAQQAAIKAQAESMGGGRSSSGGRTVSRADYNALVLANGKAGADAILKASNASVAP